jgi:hypothetical protein
MDKKDGQDFFFYILNILSINVNKINKECSSGSYLIFNDAAIEQFQLSFY